MRLLNAWFAVVKSSYSRTSNILDFLLCQIGLFSRVTPFSQEGEIITQLLAQRIYQQIGERLVLSRLLARTRALRFV